MMEELRECGFGFHIGCIAWALDLASRKEAVGLVDSTETALDHVGLSKCDSARFKVVGSCAAVWRAHRVRRCT